MEQGNTSLTIKISGKNQRGETFQEVARLEAFGNFGVLIYTLQPLGLGDIMHITGNNNRPIACGEIIWVRGGDSPCVEVLLHRNTSIDEVLAINESVVPQKTAALPSLSSISGGVTKPLSISSLSSSGKTSALSANSLSGATKSLDSSTIKGLPNLSGTEIEPGFEGESLLCSSCNKANLVTSKSCKFCGSYLSRNTATLKSTTLGKIVQEVKSAHGSGATASDNTIDIPNQTKLGATTSLNSKIPSVNSGKTENVNLSGDSVNSSSSSVRASRSARSETTGSAKKISAKDRERLNVLAQQQKIGLIVLILFSILFAATFLPIGSSFEPSPLDVVEQTGCVHVGTLKRQASEANRTGELEYWTQDKDKTTVQFIRKPITVGNAIAELDSLTKAGAEVHGYWCPKAESKLVTKAQLPKNLTGLWTFNPTGAKAKDATTFSLQLKDRTLVIKEKVDQIEVERTKDIKQATYYTGQQKLTVILNDVGNTKVNSATLREFNFYLPSGQDPVPSVEGVLSNTVRPFYIGEYKDNASQIDLRQILMYVFGGLSGLSLVYLGFNFYQMKSVL
ncbi:MAG: hypothetical protein HY819_03555 [Acidobacteria bacterium]|nr:hypothetical protein [Acidobacteriota bacterium]